MNERKRSEEKMKQMEFCIDNIADAVHWITMDGRFWNVNAVACEMLEYSREELLSFSIPDIDPDYTHEHFQSDFAELKRTGILRLKRFHMTRDGRIIPVEITAKYFTYNDVEYICNIVCDITARVKAEKEASFFRTLIEYTRDPVYVVNHTKGSRLVYVNEAACLHYGREREELLTMRTFDLDATLDQEDIDDLHEELKNNKSLHFETIHRVASGELVPVYVTTSYLEFDGDELAVGHFHDLSERRRIEDELRQAHDELEKRVEERMVELRNANKLLQREIAERKRGEEALLFSRFCIDKAAIGIFQTDENGTIFSVNDYACASLGYSKDELCALSVFDIDPVITHEKMLEIKKMLDETGFSTHETTHRRRDGTTFSVEITANLLGFQGKTFGISFVKDITERKRVEEALRKSRQMLMIVLDNFPGVVFWKNCNSLYLGCNKNFSLAAGLAEPSEIVGRSDHELPWKNDAERYLADDHQVIQSGVPKLNIVETLLHADGRVAWFETSKVPLFDADGNVIAVLGVSNDITERKRAEEARRASEAEKSLILNSTMDYVVYHDTDMKIVWANWKAGKLANLPVEELTGRHCWEVLHRRDKPCEGCPVVLARDTIQANPRKWRCGISMD